MGMGDGYSITRSNAGFACERGDGGGMEGGGGGVEERVASFGRGS